MKLTAYVGRRIYMLLLVILCAYPNALEAQAGKKTTVQIKASGHTLQQVLSSMELQTGYSFSYTDNDPVLQQKVTLSFSGTWPAALEKLSAVAGVEFLQTGSVISVRKQNTNTAALPIVRGTVYDADNNPLGGVSIQVLPDGRTVQSNDKGNFSVRVSTSDVSATVKLQFSFIGMQPRTISARVNEAINVTMNNDPVSMQELVVTSAYTGERRREEVVGSIAQVTSKQLQTNRPIESLDKLLEGLVAGVQVETNTALNTPVKINVRGVGSLTNIGGARTTSSQPLYIINGIPVYEQQKGDENTAFNNENYLNPLSNINPQDIKSIAVLKDASASAIYGANAANGVIIITTKSGTAGKSRLNLNYQSGFSRFINQMKYLNGPQYYEVLRETYINNGLNAATASSLAGSSTVNTDWFALTNRNPSFQNVNMDFSGGSGNTTFRFSSGYRNQKSNAMRNDMQKIYFRLSVDHKISDRFKAGIEVSPTITRQNTLQIYNQVILPPNVSPYNEDGSFAEMPGQGVPNPLAIIAQNDDYHNSTAMTATAFANYQVTPAITLSARVGGDYYENKETIYESSQNATGRSQGGFLQIFDRKNLGWISFLQASYDKTFGSKHTVHFLAGTEVQDAETNLLRGSGTRFTFDRLRSLTYAGTRTTFSSRQQRASVSYYSQLSYDFLQKYYLNVNARGDKSSVFGGDKQLAVNSSIGAGWIISKEQFFKAAAPYITFLRARGSYGSTGNSRIGTYAARGLYTFSGSAYNGNTASTPNGQSAPNPDLGWEKNFKLNVGLDITLFNKVQVTAEYYNNTIKDLISAVNVPQETGFTTISVNSGTMQNRGFELTIKSTNIERRNFQWNTSFNYSFNRNKVTRFNNGYSSQYSADGSGLVTREGLSTSTIWGWQWAGVNPQTGEEAFYDNTGKIVDARTITTLGIANATSLGDRTPKFQGGMVNTFQVGRFGFSFNLIYSWGASTLYSFDLMSYGRNLNHRNQSVNLIDRWQKPGDITDVPRLYYPRSFVRNSNRTLLDLTYIKLSNVALDYSLPAAWAGKAGMSRLQVYANANNIYYWYRQKSPEGRNGAAEMRFLFPETSAFTFGITAGF